MNYNESKLSKLLSIMDVDYIEENPYDAWKLMQWMYSELTHRYDVIQMQRETLMLSKAIIEELKSEDE